MIVQTSEHSTYIACVPPDITRPRHSLSGHPHEQAQRHTEDKSAPRHPNCSYAVININSKLNIPFIYPLCNKLGFLWVQIFF